MLFYATGSLSHLNTRQLMIVLATGHFMQEIQATLLKTAAETLTPRDAGRLLGMILYEFAMDAAVGAVAAASLGAGSPALAARLPLLARKVAKIPGGEIIAEQLQPDGILYKLIMDLAKTLTQSRKTRGGTAGIAPRGVDWVTDAMKGWKNGEVIPESVVKRLSSRLYRNKVSVIQNKWALEILDRSGDGAQFVRFKDGSAGLLLRPNATRYQIVHELKHYDHWLADPKKYGTLSKLEREEYVFKALQKSHHWQVFNYAERAHALEYIEYVRRLHGN